MSINLRIINKTKVGQFTKIKVIKGGNKVSDS